MNQGADRYPLACCMPLRDPGPELLETMASFEQCDVKPFLIVVDDGSAVPVEIDFARFGLDGMVFRFKGKVGISAALNAALILALGLGFQVIARMDGDDLNHAARFSKQLAYLDRHPECLAVFGGADLIDESGALTGSRTPPSDTGRLLRAMAMNNVLIHPTAALRADYISRIGLYSDAFPRAEDYDYFMRGLAEGVVHVMNTRLISYRLRQGSVSFSHYRQQLVSRLRVQWRYLRLFGAAGWIGMARTLGLLLAGYLLPVRTVGALRRRWSHAFGPGARTLRQARSPARDVAASRSVGA
jgi:glycosyltransferase involved in cell wall biosynthesis